jgi:hypothetical protein
MRKNIIIVICMLALLFTAHGVYATQTIQVASVCTDTGLSGPALQENTLFCANGTNIAGSVYQASINLAKQKNIIVGTPTSVVASVDWGGVPVTIVTFTSGLHAEHHTDQFVRIYSPYSNQVYP